MKRKLVFGGLALLGATVLGLWVAAPRYVESQIHKQHPEVSFGSLELSWSKVTLHNVTIDKGWIKATAETAIIDDSTKAVRLSHGHVDIDLDRRPEHGGSSKSEQPNVTADGLSVIVVSKQHDLTATLNDVSVDEKTVKAASGDVRHGWYHVGLGATEIARDFKHVKLAEVGFPDGFELPASLPAIVHPGLSGVDIDLEHRTATVSQAGFELADDQSVEFHTEGVHVTLNADKVEVSLDHADVSHPRLAIGPVGFEHVEFEVGQDWKQPLDVTINGAKVHVDPETKSVSGDEECSTWVKALPRELAAPPISGQTEWRPSRLKFALGLLPKPHFSLSGTCSALCTDPTLVKLRHHFMYVTYDAKGQRNAEQREAGPDEPEWVPMAQISSNMMDAVANMEDWGFWSHHGYVAAALEQSFLEDVRTDKFSRGGSTITMQTAKNIFLTREKTVGRKISELFLSQVLESCFSKKEIMELYLNVVEFGPNIYGLREAAKHYFNEDPLQLGPQQAFYLAWILPRPRSSPPPDPSTLERVASLMRMLEKNGRLTESQALSIEPADTKGWEAYH